MPFNLSLGLRSAGLNAAVFSGTSLLIALLRGIYALAIARLLGPVGYGLLSYAVAWYMAFLPISQWGMNIILSRDVGRKRLIGEQLVGHTLLLRLILAALAGAACGITGTMLEGGSAAFILMIVSFGLFARSIALWASNVFIAYEKAWLSARQTAIFRPIEMGFGIGIVALGGSVTDLVIWHVASWWIEAAVGLYLIQTKIQRIRFNWDWMLSRRILMQGAWFGATSVLAGLMMQGGLVISRFVEGVDADLGQVALAFQVFGILTILPSVLGSVILPVLSRASQRKDGKEIWFGLVSIQISTAIGAVVALFITLVAPSFVRTFLGTDYLPAIELIGPAAWLSIPFSWAAALLPVLAAMGYVRAPTFVSFLALIALGVTVPICMQELGLVGVIVGVGIGMWVRAIGLLYLLRVDKKGVLKVASRSLIFAAAAFIVLEFLSKGSMIGMFVALVLPLFGISWSMVAKGPQNVLIRN